MKRFWLLFTLIVPVAAVGSYDSSTAQDRLNGTFSSEITLPVTQAIFVKKSNWGSGSNYAMALSADFSTVADWLAIQNNSAEDRAAASTVSSGGSSSSANADFTAGLYDDEWVCVVGISESTTSRKIYIGDSTTTATNTASRAVTGIDSITVGTAPTGLAPNNGLFAEPAVWGVVLSTEEIDDYCGGLRATHIQSEELLGYWPLDTDQGTHADQSGNGGPTLTAQSDIPFSADHPTITDPDTQIIEITSIASGSPCDLFNDATEPDIVAGDELHAPLSTSPGGEPPEDFELTILPDCTFSYVGDGTKQTANVLVFDTSAGDFHADDIDFVDNNNAPVNNGTLGSDPIVLKLNEAMTPLDICSGFDDIDGDDLTITADPAVATAVPGTALSGDGNCSMGGTPDTENEAGTSVEFTATDDAEESDTVSVTFYVIDTVTVPTYVDLDSAITLHQETFPWQTDELALIIKFACHDTVAANDVISQDPEPDAEIEAFDPVNLTVSMGICPIRKKLLMLTR